MGPISDIKTRLMIYWPVLLPTVRWVSAEPLSNLEEI